MMVGDDTFCAQYIIEHKADYIEKCHSYKNTVCIIQPLLMTATSDDEWGGLSECHSMK